MILRAMEIDEFWGIIERSGDDAEALESLLRGRSREDLRAFDRIFDEQLTRASRWDVWGAGYVANGGMSDDSFDYFCEWLIGSGRTVFEQVLADPDSLADVPGVEEASLEAEGLAYAAHEAYDAAYDEEMPDGGGSDRDEPAGEEWDEGDLDRLYPRLSAKFA